MKNLMPVHLTAMKDLVLASRETVGPGQDRPTAPSLALPTR